MRPEKKYQNNTATEEDYLTLADLFPYVFHGDTNFGEMFLKLSSTLYCLFRRNDSISWKLIFHYPLLKDEKQLVKMLLSCTRTPTTTLFSKYSKCPPRRLEYRVRGMMARFLRIKRNRDLELIYIELKIGKHDMLSFKNIKIKKFFRHPLNVENTVSAQNYNCSF